MPVALPMATARKCKPKPKGYKPFLKRSDLEILTARLVACQSLAEASSLLTRFVKGRKRISREAHRRGTTGYYLRRLARTLRMGRPGFSVFSRKNTKLPFHSFSTLPKHTCPGAGECLSWCYSFTAWRHPNAWARQVQNTLFLRFKPDVIRDAFLALPEGIILRLYVDGDFDSEQTIAFWFDLLGQRPDVKAYGYSKSWELLHQYASRFPVPANYLLNLSSGGREQTVTRKDMQALPFTRGDFIALPVAYKGERGFNRYTDPAYHRAVREAARSAGLGKVFSCPGKCGECCNGHHACGSDRMAGVTVAIGIHTPTNNL